MILIVDSFFTGSHKYWGNQLRDQLSFDVELLTLSGKFWKWRMEGGAIELAEKFKKLKQKPSLIIATDMVNIPMFYAHAGITKAEVPCIMYFHENQFAYPVNDQDSDIVQNRDNHYGFINLSSALFANELVFNSDFNKTSFFNGVRELTRKLPDNNLTSALDKIRSQVIYPGIEDIKTKGNNKPNIPVILWNHRWEYDKNPELFIKGLEYLQKKDITFKLIILGPGTQEDKVINLITKKFSKELIHCGFTDSRAKYIELINMATHLPVTSKHDFFGISVAEAMNAGAFAILPNHQAYPEHLENNTYSGALYNFPSEYFKTLEASLKTFNSPQTKKEFMWEAVIRDWKDLIHSLNKFDV